jgi:ABC-type transporter Mla subunit MlaD
MQTTSQNPIVNTNYFFSGSQLTETQQSPTGSTTVPPEEGDDLEGRIPAKGAGIKWRDKVSAQLGAVSGKLDDMAIGQGRLGGQLDSMAGQLGSIYGQVGSLNSQVANQTRQLNNIDNAINSASGKLDNLTANGEALAAGLGKLSGHVDALDGRVGKLDDSVKVLGSAQDATTLQVAALNARVDAGFAGLSRQIQDCCTKVIPHAPASDTPNRASPVSSPVSSSASAVSSPVPSQAKPQPAVQSAPHGAV